MLPRVVRSQIVTNRIELIVKKQTRNTREIVLAVKGKVRLVERQPLKTETILRKTLEIVDDFDLPTKKNDRTLLKHQKFY